jgi:hypothetical protein
MVLLSFVHLLTYIYMYCYNGILRKNLPYAFCCTLNTDRQVAKLETSESYEPLSAVGHYTACSLTVNLSADFMYF